MNNIFGSKNQAFYRFATILLPIPVIPETAWVTYIQNKFKAKNIDTDEVPLKNILEFTGGHPQDTMLVCSKFIFFFLKAGKNQLTLELAKIGYESALLTLEPVFDEILDEIGKSRRIRQALLSIARGIESMPISKETPMK